jgi:diguanylate cyclase (GGDEF)-like protein
VLLFDIDHFKQINDRYGHLSGDYVLKELADLLRNRIRKEELLARYGGEEFVIILPESDKAIATDFAEIIRRKVEGHTFEFEGQKMRVTISVGVASMSQDTRNISELLKLSDMAMYKAKNGGRNKVETA